MYVRARHKLARENWKFKIMSTPPSSGPRSDENLTYFSWTRPTNGITSMALRLFGGIVIYRWNTIAQLDRCLHSIRTARQKTRSRSLSFSLCLSQRYLTSNLEGQQRIRRPVRSMGEWREISGFFPYPALDMLNDSASCVKKVENDYWELSIYIRDSACLSSINIENHPRIC